MNDPAVKPDTINKLRAAADSACAMQAGTESKHREWLAEAGFVDVERASYTLAGEMSLMIARKPD